MKKIMLLILMYVFMIGNISFAAGIRPHPRTRGGLIISVVISFIVVFIGFLQDLEKKHKDNQKLIDYFYKRYKEQEGNWCIVRNIGLLDMPFKFEGNKRMKDKYNTCYMVNKEQEIFGMECETIYYYDIKCGLLRDVYITFKNQKQNENLIIKNFDHFFIGWKKFKNLPYTVSRLSNSCNNTCDNTYLEAKIKLNLNEKDVKISIDARI